MNEIIKMISKSSKVSILADDSTSGIRTEKHDKFSAIEDDEYVALRAAIPVISDMPPTDCSDRIYLSYKLYTTHFLLLNQKHSWRHVPSCFKTSTHVQWGNCRYNFPRVYQETQKMVYQKKYWKRIHK